ncbi:hypothetical protein O0I10_010035 [Lichtheimia ornata]|uniref:Uncharacterized protein n=1 Tax=Lichtheimia ornata TaxID=688661 RepID=A0AAD7UVJ8_9FUNG|nr:uncharacterized protein O0I10_010035 [Lichtheimia ornata]KAJ8654339.1 hypothetical protein O0I10_010035 [Lichtheimia ornata]
MFEMDAYMGCLRLKAPHSIHRLQHLLDQHVLSYQSFACRACVPPSLFPGVPNPATMDHNVDTLIACLKFDVNYEAQAIPQNHHPQPQIICTPRLSSSTTTISLEPLLEPVLDHKRKESLFTTQGAMSCLVSQVSSEPILITNLPIMHL